MACRRNAFLMLLQVDQNRALSFLTSCLDQVGSFGDILQLVIVELIYKVSYFTRFLNMSAAKMSRLINVLVLILQVCHHNPGERSKFIRCIYNLLTANSSAVRYEAAGTLVTLSNAPSAIKVCVLIRFIFSRCSVSVMFVTFRLLPRATLS